MHQKNTQNAKEILDIPIYEVNGSEGGREDGLGCEGGTDFPQNHDIELRNVWFSYKVNGSEGGREGGLDRDGKTNVLQGVNLKIKDGERMALVGLSLIHI